MTDTKVQGESVQHIGFVEKGEIKKGDSLTAKINQVDTYNQNYSGEYLQPESIR